MFQFGTKSLKLLKSKYQNEIATNIMIDFFLLQKY